MLALGIDIGSSKIVIAVCQSDKANILFTSTGERTTPFCIAFNKNEQLFSYTAEYQATVNRENTIFGKDVFRTIGRVFNDIEFEKSLVQVVPSEANNASAFTVKYKSQNVHISPELALSMVLSKATEHIKLNFNQECLPAVVTVPSAFNSAQRYAIKNACTAAGLEVLSILNNATASAITYCLERNYGEDKNVLIFDMGATTLDVGIFEVRGKKITTKYIGGDSNLGGENFVEILVQHFLDDFRRSKRVDLKNDKNSVERLYIAAEKIKKMLSTSKDAVHTIEAFYNEEPHQLTLSRVEFETLCRQLFERIEDTVTASIQGSGLNTAEIDEFIIVGGGGRIPKVEKSIKNAINGRDLSKILNQDESMALGAAYLAANIKHQKHFNEQAFEVQNATFLPVTMQINNFDDMIDLLPDEFLLPLQKSLSSFPSNISYLKILQNQLVMYENFGNWNIREATLFMNFDGLIQIVGKIDSEARKTNIINHMHVDKQKVEELRGQAAIFKEYENETKQILDLRNDIEDSCYKYKRSVQSPEMQDQIDDDSKNELIRICQDTISWLDHNPNAGLETLKKQKNTLEIGASKIKYAQEKAQINNILEQSNLQFQNRNYERATKGFSRLIEYFLQNDPSNMKTLSALHKYRAQCYFHLDQFKECLADFKNVSKADIDMNSQEMCQIANQTLLEQKVFACLSETEMLYEKNEFFEALKLNNFILNELLPKTSRNARCQVHLQRGRIYYALKLYQDAIQCLNIAAENLDLKLESLEWRSLCFVEINDFDSALNDYNEFKNNGRNPCDFTEQKLAEPKRVFNTKRATTSFRQYENFFQTGNYTEMKRIKIDQQYLSKSSQKLYLYYKIFADYKLNNIENVEKMLNNVGRANQDVFVLFMQSAVFVRLKNYKPALTKCQAAQRISNGNELKDYEEMIDNIISDQSLCSCIRRFFSGRAAITQQSIEHKIEETGLLLLTLYRSGNDSIFMHGNNQNSYQVNGSTALRHKSSRNYTDV